MKEHALIVYFSGTGNTWLAADAIAKRIEKRGIPADLLRLEEAPQRLDISNYSLLGLGYPMCGNTSPLNFKGFIRNLPASEGMLVFVFATMAFAAMGSHSLFAEKLAARGYKVLGGRYFLAANNESSALGPSDPAAPEIIDWLDRIKKEAGDFADEVLRGESGLDEKDSSLKKASLIIGSFVGFAIKHFAWRNARVTSLCKNCGLCEEICPQGSISNSLVKPRFGKSCIRCERCVNFCPSKAIMHPFRLVDTDLRYRAPGYKPPILRKPTGG